MIRIALDAIGGDHAPDVPVEGAAAALSELSADHRILLLGPEAPIRRAIERHHGSIEQLEVVEAPDVDEKPITAVRGKRRSSVRMDSIVCHGDSPARAFTNAIHMASRAAATQVSEPVADDVVANGASA